MKYAFILIVLMLTGATLPAQSPESDRMQRDIEVAENIIATLLNETEVSPYPALGLPSEVEGSYLEGFGLLFTIAPRYLIRGFRIDNSRRLRPNPESEVIVVPDRQRPERERERNAPPPSNDQPDTGELFRTIVTTFATDYAYLLRQLPAGEKLMIRYGNAGSPSLDWRVAGLSRASAEEQVRSALIEKTDIDAFSTGRLSREKFLARIRFTTESRETGDTDRDLVLLSSIFSRLYESDLSERFRLYGSVDFERIEGLGAIYTFTLGPKPDRGLVYFSDGQRFRLRERGGLVVPMPENPTPADEKVSNLETAFPAFLEDLKANIIEYGSIVKNLAPGEALIFRVKFAGTGDSTTIPEALKITCRQETLDSYRNNKISLEKAVEQLREE